MTTASTLATTCGQLLVCGFAGARLAPTLRGDLAAGRRGGIIFFRRNLPTLETAAELCAEIAGAAPPGRPPWIGIDEEGGRVRRLPAPAIALPSMRRLAELGPGRLSQAASLVARELAALGININFAPVLDVNSNPSNPVIGDRAFGADPDTVIGSARAYLQAIAGHVMACGKHFPGHGDTCADSHLELPRVPHDRARLDAIELAPFRAAIAAGIPALMSAHVVVEGIDPDRPATLSSRLCTELLRGALGFRGVLFSDDLEMKAVAGRYAYGDAAVQAVAAGCDVLLVCSDEEAQSLAFDALVREAERSAAFRARCAEAAERGLAARRAVPPRPLGYDAVRAIVEGPEARALLAVLSPPAPSGE